MTRIRCRFCREIFLHLKQILKIPKIPKSNLITIKIEFQLVLRI
jgi:hypothetical protein